MIHFLSGTRQHCDDFFVTSDLSQDTLIHDQSKQSVVVRNLSLTYGLSR